MNSRIVVKAHHFAFSADTQLVVQQAVSPLLSLSQYVSRIDVAIQGIYTTNTQIRYRVELRVRLRSELIHEFSEGDAILPAVNAAVAATRAKLEGEPVPS